VTLLDVLIVLLVGGALAYVIQKAPAALDAYKPFALWVLLIVIVVLLLSQFGAFNRILNHRIGS